MKETDVASGVERGRQLSGRVKEKLSDTIPVMGKEIPIRKIILAILGLLFISLIVWSIVSYLSPAPPGPAPPGPAPPGPAPPGPAPPGSAGSNSVTVDGSVDSSPSDGDATIARGGSVSSSGTQVVPPDAGTPPPPPPPPNTNNQQRNEDMLALCAANSGVENSSFPACNDPNLIRYWDNQTSRCK